MISVDTNVLLYAQNQDCPEHESATKFLTDCAGRDDIVICELVLMELYQLLRNSTVLSRPLSAPQAAKVCRTFRSNPRWALVENAPVMENVWQLAARPNVARRKLFDARLAFTLRHHGVTDLATKNTKGFAEFGFERVWDPTG